MTIESVAQPSDQPEIPVDVATAAETPDAEAASSSAEIDVKEAPKTLRDVLQDVIKPAEAEVATSPLEAEKKDDPSADEVKADAEDPDDSKLPFGKHPRWKEVLGQRDAARTERDELATKVGDFEKQIAELSAPAEEYRAIETFMANAGMERSEVVELLQVGALAKSDPEKALPLVAQFFEDLLVATGRKLPEDVQKDVNDGLITEDRARELVQIKRKASLAEARAETSEATLKTTAEQTAHATLVSQIEAATDEWESQAKVKDPDFDAKQPFVARTAQAIAAAEGIKVSSPEIATELLQRAYKQTNADLQRVLPKKTEILLKRPSSPSADAVPVAKSFREAIAIAARTAARA